MTSDARQECVALVKVGPGLTWNPSHIGTAFLASALGKEWLISALHVPIYENPHDDWARWPKRAGLELDFPRRKGKKFPLFKAGTSTPNFVHFKTEDGVVADFMAFELPHIGITERLRSRLRVFNIEVPENPPLKVGDTVHVFGYPIPEQILTSAAHTVFQLATPTNPLQTERKVLEGFSGGPVLTDHGELVGMAIGNTEDEKHGNIIARATLLELLKAGVKP